MANRLLTAALAAMLVAHAEGISCYVGSGLNTDLLWAPTGASAGLQALFAPDNFVTPPPPMFAGSLVDCETVSASANSTHCVTYTSGASRSWACSNPAVSSGVTLNNCTAGGGVAGAVCCNTASGCNTPIRPQPAWEAVTPSARRCWQNPVAASAAAAQAQQLAVRHTMPMHAAATMKALVDLGDEAKRFADRNTTAIVRPPLVTSLAPPTVAACAGDNTTRGAGSCATMVWHNYMGYNISVPVWGCVGPHLTAMGIVGGGTRLTGVAAGGNLVTEAVARKYTQDALGRQPPAVPSIPTFSQADQDAIASTFATTYGPDMIAYKTCDTDECNAAPAPSTNQCFMLNPGSLARAATLPALEALAALSNTPQSCRMILWASDVCVTVKALGIPVLGGCYSTFLQGVGVPDLSGGGIRVDCGAEGTAAGQFYIPSVFLSGVESMVPANSVEFECCKGALCNKAAAQAADNVLAKGVEATFVLKGVTEMSVFVDKIKMPLESGIGELTGVPLFEIRTIEVCYQGTCTEFVNGLNPAPTTSRRHGAEEFAVFVHINENPATTGDQARILSVINGADFATQLTQKVKDASGIDVTVEIDSAVESVGGARPALDGGVSLSAGYLLPFLTSLASVAYIVGSGSQRYTQ